MIIIYLTVTLRKELPSSVGSSFFFCGIKRRAIHIEAGREGRDIGDYALEAALTHECGHGIKKYAPRQFEELKRFIKKNFYTEGSWDAAVSERQAQYESTLNKEFSWEKAEEEVVCNSLGKLLSNQRVMNKLAAEHRNIFARVWKAVTDFFEKLVSRIRRVGEYSSRTPEQRIVEQGAAKLQRALENKFVTALRDANTAAKAVSDVKAAEKAKADVVTTDGSNSAKTGENPAVTNTNGQKMHVSEEKRDYFFAGEHKKITAYMSDEERTEILSKKQVIAPVYTGQADATILENKESFEEKKMDIVKAVIEKLGEEFGIVGGQIIFEDVDIEITLSKTNLRESTTKQATPAQLAKLIPVLKSSAEKAIGIERHDNRYFFDNDTVCFDNLLGGYVDGEDFVPVRFGLKHSRTGNVVLYVVIDQNKIPLSYLTEIKNDTGHQDAKSDLTEVGSPRRRVTYSISQIIGFVNSEDLLRYIPDQMLSEEQRTTKWNAIATTVQYTDKKNDRKYFEYIKKGNIRDARRMIVAAAKTAGYTIHAYHGSNAEFNVFDQSIEGALGEGIYFAESKEYAQGVAPNGKLYDVFLKITNPFEAKYPGGISQENLIKQGYDGVHHEGNGFWVAFDTSQVKSAETITYDDKGNIIPLSKRFNESNPDIRYSLADKLDREALAEAFYGLAATDEEREAMRQYRAEIEDIDDKLSERARLLRRYDEIGDKRAFAGERERLREQIDRITDDVTRKDRKLLEISAAKPFRDMVERYEKNIGNRRNTAGTVTMSRGEYEKNRAKFTHSRFKPTNVSAIFSFYLKNVARFDIIAL